MLYWAWVTCRGPSAIKGQEGARADVGRAPPPGQTADWSLQEKELLYYARSVVESVLTQLHRLGEDLTWSLCQFCLCPINANRDCGKYFVIIFVILNIH